MGATSHTRKDQRVIDKLDNTVYGLQAIKNEIVDPTHGLHEIEGLLEDTDYGLAQARIDRGTIKHDWINRPRPYPYDLTWVDPVTGRSAINIVAGVGADTFGVYTSLIPRGTFDFGDTPNLLQTLSVNFEIFSANDVYILEFYSSDDDATYHPIGAIRVIRSAVQIRSFIVSRPCHDYNCDNGTLYARLKSVTGGNNLDISLTVERHLHTDYDVSPSTGVWPTG